MPTLSSAREPFGHAAVSSVGQVPKGWEIKKEHLSLCYTPRAASCSTENNLEDTLFNVVESGANMAIDSLHNAANKELERHTGIDSLATKIKSADTIDGEREVKRKSIEELLK